MNAAGPLGGADGRELDRLLGLADQLTILKARARYTLDRLKGRDEAWSTMP